MLLSTKSTFVEGDIGNLSLWCIKIRTETVSTAFIIARLIKQVS